MTHALHNTTERRPSARLRRAVGNSPRTARNLRAPQTGPEHLMLAILADTETMAARALRHLNINHDDFLKFVTGGREDRQFAENGALPEPTPEYLGVLVQAGNRAERAGDTYVGTYHAVAELIENPDTPVAGFFAERCVTADAFQRIVESYLIR